MTITHENFMTELNNCVIEITLVINELKKIQADTPENHDYMMQLNGRFVTGAAHLPQIIQFVAEHRPSPALVGNKLRDAINLTTELIQEKTRIQKNTPEVYRQTNDETGLN